MRCCWLRVALAMSPRTRQWAVSSPVTVLCWAMAGRSAEKLAQVRDEAAILPDQRLSFEAAVNRACACLPVEPALRQLLLEEDDLLQRHNRATTLLESILTELIPTPVAPN